MQSPAVPGSSSASISQKGTRLAIAVIVAIFAVTLLVSFNFGGNPPGFVADFPTRLGLAVGLSILVAVVFAILRAEGRRPPRM